MNFLQLVSLIPADAARSHLVAFDKPCQMSAGAADQWHCSAAGWNFKFAEWTNRRASNCSATVAPRPFVI